MGEEIETLCPVLYCTKANTISRSKFTTCSLKNYRSFGFQSLLSSKTFKLVFIVSGIYCIERYMLPTAREALWAREGAGHAVELTDSASLTK